MCVIYLEKYVTSPDDIVLDLGCGSGILSIVSALCGSENVKGIDIDPNAVTASVENIKMNGLEDKIEIFQSDITEGLGFKADIIAGNLMADLIITLASDIADHLKGKKIFISSGILIEKRREVLEALEAAGFEISGVLEENEWCAVAARLT